MRVAAGGTDLERGVLAAWEVASQDRIWERSDDARFVQLAFSPDGNDLAAARFVATGLL
ncbi:MAG: hypothetical protein KDA61_07525 [Planctomycetales bacterium]|nr:hypothetical protein [Planctomycetales bacterium]